MGLKEGFAEFKEQFNKDAKATIAATNFAKERGIDVTTLDAWEQSLQQQRNELHERTIGRAVDTLAKDETIAQLLELRPLAAAVEEDEEEMPAAEQGGQPGDSAVRVLSPGTVLVSASVLDAAPAVTAGAAIGDAAGTAAVLVGCEPGAAGSNVLRQLEGEIRERREAKLAAEVELAAARAQKTSLEARWAEIIAVSEDAAKGAQEAKQHAELLRTALEEKDAKLVETEDAKERMEMERQLLKRRHADLEAAFQERFQREVSQKEQELLDDVAYLRRSQEVREQRLQDLTADKERLQHIAVCATPAGGRLGAPGTVEAHLALARAFGHDDSAEHPCLRLWDEPALKLSSWLLKMPWLRRVFFLVTLVAWVVALRSALAPGASHVIHS